MSNKISKSKIEVEFENYFLLNFLDTISSYMDYIDYSDIITKLLENQEVQEIALQKGLDVSKFLQAE